MKQFKTGFLGLSSLSYLFVAGMQILKIVRLNVVFFLLLVQSLQGSAQLIPKQGPKSTQKPTPPVNKEIKPEQTPAHIPNKPGQKLDEIKEGPQVFTATNEYRKMNLQLPFSTTLKSYMVMKQGNFFVLNGDIIVGYDYPKTMAASKEDNDYRWPDGTMPILIDASIYENGLGQIVHEGLREFNTKAELCLVPREKQKDYVKISFSSDIVGAGLSLVGRNGGEQPLLLSSKADKGTVLHELMHAAGFYHEQNREDRDRHVRINENNLKDADKTKHNFQIEESAMYGDYDYCSIMHYDSLAFSNGSPTIQCIAEGKVIPCPPCMGQRNTFSPTDLAGIDRFYGNISRFPCQTPFPDPEYQPLSFPTAQLSESNKAMQIFRQYADYATANGFVGAYPTFHIRQYGADILAGTLLLKPGKAIWKDIPLSNLNYPSLEDFGARMRAVQQYANRNGFVAGFPNYYHEDYGKGVVCGTILLGTASAEWRDVPIAELGNPNLDDIGARKRSAHDYAVRNGYESGFPTFFHATYQRLGMVCGIVLIKKGAGEFRERQVGSIVR